MNLILETFARVRGGAEACRRWGARAAAELWVSERRVILAGPGTLGSGEGVPSPDVEGDAGQSEGHGIAGGIEVRHAVEPVGALERAENRLHRAPDQRELVVVGDLRVRQRSVPLRPPHDAVFQAALLQ